MRGKNGLAVAAILLGSVPIAAQVRPIAVRQAPPPARPVLLPNRTITYVRPAAFPVRVVNRPAVRVLTTQVPQTSPNSAPAGANAAPAPTFRGASFHGAVGTPVPLGQLLNPAPGLGFDFTHLAAINGDLAVRALIDPLTQQQLALIERLPREQPVDVGFFPAYAGTPVVVAPAQPQVIVVQQPVPQPAPAPQAAPAAQAAAPPAPPLPDIGEFVLVRRDGKLIHTVAFSRQGSRIVYITAAGLRHSVPVDQLDLKTTEERNAELGTILHLSN